MQQQYRSERRGPQDLRQLMADKHNKSAALAELGKVGIRLTEPDKPSDQLPRNEMLARRADLRRSMNALRNHAKASPENLTDDLITATEYLAAEIELISNQLDMDDAAEAMMTGRSFGDYGSDQILDRGGNRIGVLLDADTLRDEQKIASKLGKDQRNFSGEPREDGSLTAFFRGIAGGRTTEAIRDALTEGTDSQGGHAVPSWLLPGILKALVPASSMLTAGANVAVLQQPGDSFKIAAVNSVPTASWRLEAGTLNESDATFRGITVIPQSLAFIFKVSRELLMDAPGMEAALRVAIAQAFAIAIDKAGLMGSGTAPEIRGVLNTTGVNTYDMGENGGVLANYAPIIKARRTIADDNAPEPTAIITSTRESETIDLFADTTGQPLNRPPALERLRFLTTSQIPTTGEHGTASNASNMFLGDFTQATFYMREALSVQKLNELYAGSGEIGFACHARVDLALAYPSAFCVMKGVIPTA